MAIGPTTHLKGIQEVMSNLNKEIAKIENGAMSGLIRAAVIVRRDMDSTPPVIPVETGNLRSSFFIITNRGSTKMGDNVTFRAKSVTTGNMVRSMAELAEITSYHSSVLGKSSAYIQGFRMAKRRKGVAIIFGFGAYYATFVHEMIGAINWNRTKPQSGAKFFQAALRKNEKAMLDVIAKEAKVK